MRSRKIVCSALLIAVFLLALSASTLNCTASSSLTVGLAENSRSSSAVKSVKICFNGDVVTIIRDEFGIPHINGSSQQAVFFGFGYAQAEDAIETIMLNYLTATGTLSKTFGPSGHNNTWYPGLSNLESDVLLRMLWVPASEEDYVAINDTIRRVMIEPFAAGINYYIYTHWGSLPSWIKENAPVTSIHVGSMGKLINLLFSSGVLREWMSAEKAIKSMGVEKYLEQYQSDAGLFSTIVGASPTLYGGTLGSNQWAVNGSRSATGYPMYGMDPHLPWDGVLQWYEAHIMAPAHDGLPELNVMGAIFFGLPFIGMGHNEYIAWSETVNQVDVGDVWIERLNEDNTMYLYNGTWHPIEKKTITVPVKISGIGVIYYKLPVSYTHHGVLLTINETDHWALAVNYSTSKSVVGFEQWYRVNTAQNLTQFKEAWSLLGTAIFNVMYADVHGNIFYVWNGVCPRRNDTFNWSAAVPGWIPETDWGPVIPFSELPQQENPESGWMQNCNIPAWNITTQPNNITEQGPFPKYLVGWDGYRGMSRYTRGYMLYNMLLSNDNVTIDDMLSMAVDVSVSHLAGDCIGKLPDSVPGGSQELNEAIGALKAWDMRMTNQTAATIFQLWAQKLMDKCRETYGKDATIWDFENYIGNLTQEQAVETLNETVNYMLQVYGNVSVYWANVHYVVRGQHRVGLSGTDGEPFGCLNPRWYTFNEKTGEWRCTGGSSFIMVVHLQPNNVSSLSVLPYGVSNKPDSPHYADQLLNYYSKDTLHPDYFYMDEILAHRESISNIPVYTLNETIEMINRRVVEELLATVQTLAALNMVALAVVNQTTSSSLTVGAAAAVVLAAITVASARRKPKTPA
ncbi:MAG: penicillin acylase family protein [Candidatus Freyarchaeota archaeon]|nr:penicillin acylase family protein [Candidatus Jordarchaeia archaeon]